MELLPVVNVEPELGVLEGEAWAWDQPELAAEVDKEEEKELRRRLDQLQRAEEAELEAARARLGQERARLLADLAGDTQEAEEVMRRTLASVQRTQSLVESIRSTTDFSEDASSRTRTEAELSSDDAVR